MKIKRRVCVWIWTEVSRWSSTARNEFFQVQVRGETWQIAIATWSNFTFQMQLLQSYKNRLTRSELILEKLHAFRHLDCLDNGSKAVFPVNRAKRKARGNKSDWDFGGFWRDLASILRFQCWRTSARHRSSRRTWLCCLRWCALEREFRS